MTKNEVHVNFKGRIVFVGFGSIGQGILPLILRHIGTSAERITIVSADDAGHEEAEHYGVAFVKTALTRDNYRRTLAPLLSAGDFLLNLSVDVSSVALIELARERGALYLDTCIEPWAGGYVDPNATVESRSNYAMRLDALKLRDRAKDAPTAVLTHGANPGLVSHLVKQALMNIAKDTHVDPGAPASRADWAKLAQHPRHQGHSYRRARHAGGQRPQAAQRVRQYLVGGRLRQRRRAAGRTRLGHTREAFSRGRWAP